MRILIYMPKNKLKPIGGPAGYLYNLNLGLEKIGNTEVHFLPETGENEHAVLKSIYHAMPYELRNRICNIIEGCKKLFSNKAYQNQILFDNFCSLLNGETNLPDNYQQYDIIHFHTTFELYREREKLRNYTGKVLLNSHSPQPNHQEYIAFFKDHPRREEVLQELIKADIYAFDRADSILFPCQEAEEPYYNNWDLYEDIHNRNKNKYHYLITGIKQCKIKIQKETIRKAYNIPNDAFVVCYVGRHNSIKGYDSLKSIGKRVIDKLENVYFLIAGKEGPMYGISDDRWIEVGWTDDPHSIMNAADIFVLPNKETYFDLIMLEVMSLGIPVLATKTGGNKYFEKEKCTGIRLYESEKECINDIIEFVDNREQLITMSKNNTDFFNDKLNEVVFAKNYIKTIQGILHEK